MMPKHDKFNSFLFLGFAFISFSGSLVLHQYSAPPVLEVARQQTAINLHHDFLKVFALGNKRLISNMLWIQTLLSSDETHYRGKKLASWMYLRFLTISDLDPRFYENYLWGGIYLSIIKDDLYGAADIFERGLEKFPNDYRLNFTAGFNYYFEMGEYQKGLEKLITIENDPQAPMGLKFIINKLRFESTSDYENTLNFLMYQYENTQSDVIKEKMRKDIYALKAQRDLECLNSGSDSCDKKDATGAAYIFSSGKWVAPREFAPYKIYRKSDSEK